VSDCYLSGSGQVEDEKHFLFYCDVYSHIRTDILSCMPNAVHNSAEDNLQYLMQHEVCKLAKYIVKAFLVIRTLFYS